MKRIIALIIAILLLTLSTVPVLASTDSQVIMQGSGRVEAFPPGVGASVTVYINTTTNIVRMQVSVPGGFSGPDGQQVMGMYTQGEVLDWGIEGNTVNIDIQGQTFLLPSREPMGEPGTAQFIGEFTGPGNRGEISLLVEGPGGPGIAFTIPGVIVVN